MSNNHNNNRNNYWSPLTWAEMIVIAVCAILVLGFIVWTFESF